MAGARAIPVLTDLIIGARPVVEAAKKNGKFNFDTPIEGLRAIDRYTVQIRMSAPDYPNLRDLLGFVGAAAREVVEAAGGDIRARPVGTGPYRLKEWKRGSRLILEANPNYREAYFPESNRKEDAELVRSMKGKRIPMAGTVEVNIIDEDITRLLLFEQGNLDYVQLRGEIATRIARRRQGEARVCGARNHAQGRSSSPSSSRCTSIRRIRSSAA